MTSTSDDPTQPLPIAGYSPQPQANIDRVNVNKRQEEIILRLLDSYASDPAVDPRWLAIARTQIEQGFMALNRAIMKPKRIEI